jgi:hypothetical protein
MIRVQTFPCALAKATADALNRERSYGALAFQRRC